MKATFEAVPDDIDALKAALIAERDRAAGVEAELAVAKAKASDDQAVTARPSAIADREVDARALRAALGTHGAAA